MDDFRKFLDKVLAPMEGGSDPPPKVGTDEVPEVPKEELERRYVAVMNALFDDAAKRGKVEVFADVVAWKLAVVALIGGPIVAGDVVSGLGAHLRELAKTQDEAKKKPRRRRKETDSERE
ncbi:MAG: hypothetical protein FIA95_07400 [Gemmatimonadetes bacterium]|nr:hypothetical protein [Gemmatimonadota bacterium]